MILEHVFQSLEATESLVELALEVEDLLLLSHLFDDLIGRGALRHRVLMIKLLGRTNLRASMCRALHQNRLTRRVDLLAHAQHAAKLTSLQPGRRSLIINL